MRFVPKLVQVNFRTGLAVMGAPAEVRGSRDKWTLRGWSTDGTVVLVEDGNCDAETYHRDSIVLLVEGKIKIENLPVFSFFKSERESDSVFIKGPKHQGAVVECGQLVMVEGRYEWCNGLARFTLGSYAWPVELLLIEPNGPRLSGAGDSGEAKQ